MGSGSSREKKISSGLQKEDHMYINNKERNGGDCDPKEEKRLYKSYKIQQLSDFSKSSNRSGLGCHSEGHDSDFSIDDDEDDIEGELDRVLAEYESRDFYSSRKHQNNSFLRSNTYSFCNSRQVYKESDFNSTPYIQKVDQMRTNKQTAFGLFGSEDVQHQMCEVSVWVTFVPGSRVAVRAVNSEPASESSINKECQFPKSVSAVSSALPPCFIDVRSGMEIDPGSMKQEPARRRRASYSNRIA
ncbi:UNVERIFIED_CONTAM: hypothetical protein FKN15_011628 [Acipenser sinensis]